MHKNNFIQELAEVWERMKQQISNLVNVLTHDDT